MDQKLHVSDKAQVATVGDAVFARSMFDCISQFEMEEVGLVGNGLVVQSVTSSVGRQRIIVVQCVSSTVGRQRIIVVHACKQFGW